MKCLMVHIEKVASSHAPASIFPKKPVIRFQPDITNCPHCSSKLLLHRTWEHTVITLDIGPFRAKEAIFKCMHNSHEKIIFRSKEIRMLVPHGCMFAFDVMIYVGKALFVRCQTEEAIVEELASKDIPISNREVSFLGKKFIIYLALAHREARQEIRGVMKKCGGYIAHLDGTVEGNSPNLFIGLDGLSGIVLDSVKLPSEKEALLVPFLQNMNREFGTPIALVHDMGRGILSAVEKVFPGVPDFICHSHFLRDIGKDLMGSDYGKLRNILSKHRVRKLLQDKVKPFEKVVADHVTVAHDLKTSIEKGSLETELLEKIPAGTAYTLVHWALKPSGDGYGFPFDRTHLRFYNRLKRVEDVLDKIVDTHLRGQIKDNWPLHQLRRLVKDVLSDQSLKTVVAQIEEKITVFDKLREALRLSLPNGKNGLNDDGDDTDIKNIEEKVKVFRKWIIKEPYYTQKEYQKMVQQIDKYWKKLFADPIFIDTPAGRRKIQPQRTNNILERFFRHIKRIYRKRTGTSCLNKLLKAMLADTPLIRNLENQEYIEILLKGRNTLEERFSQIDSQLVRKELKKSATSMSRVSQDMNKVIATPDLPDKISSIFTTFNK